MLHDVPVQLVRRVYEFTLVKPDGAVAMAVKELSMRTYT